MENQDKPLILSKENLEKYGFACFYPESFPQIKNGCWERKIEMAVGGRSKRHLQNFIIPQSLLIKLNKKTKISQHQSFQISTDKNSTEIIKLLSERAGWNQTLEDIELMQIHAEGGIFIAVYNFGKLKISLGSGVVFPVNENLFWIGMILVHPELRRQGIAQSIMRTCLAHIRLHQKYTIIGLDATPLGKQVYKAMGFKDSFMIWRSVIKTSQQKSEISKFQTVPFVYQKVQKYLLGINYMERRKIIQSLAKIPDSYNLMITLEGEIAGFALSRPGRLKPFIGPLIADSKGMASALLTKVLYHWKFRSFGEVFMDIPEHHIGSNKLFFDLDKAGNTDAFQMEIKTARSFSRMYQLILNEKKSDIQINDPLVLQNSVEAYERSVHWMKKEKFEIVPRMYGTSGPEWS